METTRLIVIILGMAAVTYATKLPLVLANKGQVILRALEGPLRHTAVAAFAAIAASLTLVRDGDLAIEVSNSFLWAALVSLATALVTRNLLATMATGMFIVLLFRAF